MIVLFEGSHILGLVLLLIGVALIVVEMILPGFGAPGIVGGILCLLGILLFARTLLQALLLLLLTVAVLTVVFLVLLRSVSRGRLSKSPLILRDSAQDGAGYASFDNLQQFVGQTGVALSMLRPSGVGEFNGKRIDVVTEGDFLPAGTRLRIDRVQGRQVIVHSIAPQNHFQGADTP